MSRDETEVVIHSDNDFATVAYLRIKSATLVPKLESFDPATVRIPPLLKGDSGESMSLDEKSSVLDTSLSQSSEGSSYHPASSIKRGNWAAVANIQTVLDTRDLSISDEVSSCFELLRGGQVIVAPYHYKLIYIKKNSPIGTFSYQTVSTSISSYPRWTCSLRSTQSTRPISARALLLVHVLLWTFHHHTAFDWTVWRTAARIDRHCTSRALAIGLRPTLVHIHNPSWCVDSFSYLDQPHHRVI